FLAPLPMASASAWLPFPPLRSNGRALAARHVASPGRASVGGPRRQCQRRSGPAERGRLRSAPVAKAVRGLHQTVDDAELHGRVPRVGDDVEIRLRPTPVELPG